MALKTLQVSHNLARPRGCSFSPSSPCYQAKLPLRLDGRITAKKHKHHKSSTSVLKCRANLHGCMDELVQSQKDQTTEIPIVLYPSVVFPGATLQLQAFEFRYRIMMQTLLQQGLKFGVIYSGENCRMTDVGCIVHVIECERLIDDRFFLTCIGEDRFRVIEIVRTKPYVVARIQVLNNQPGSEPQDDLGSLMRQVAHHQKNVAMLSDKLSWKLGGDHQVEQLLMLHSAASFSFLVARLFIDDRSEQQALLQLDDTAQRLAREGRYLERRSKYLAAIAAIKDGFGHLSCNEK
uniref:Lon N-terminal domain-containing protein n=1 Tax=Arundo donax TaxID=35708 RepID=A0A0A8XVJ8_ARUDO